MTALAALAQMPITPQVPAADRHQGGRVFLERADSLVVRPDEPDVQVLLGEVMFSRGDMLMYCDSARFYTSPALPADSMEAYGNVRMEQGDTLFLYGDEMVYSGSEQVATVYGIDRDVRLINRDVTLTSPVLNYSMAINLGWYDQGGRLTDPRNTLTSLEGEYAPPTKEANFYGHVKLHGVSEKGETIHVYTDTLLYNTDTSMAELPMASRIIGRDGDIFTTEGLFDTRLNQATLLRRSKVHTNRGNTLTGDSIFYDRDHGFGEAFGSMVLVDSAKQLTLTGDYGFYDQVIDSAYVTGHARAMEHSRPDTLHMHGDVIRAFAGPDSLHTLIAHPNVRFWRTDLQGVADSLTFIEADTTVRLDYDPVVWSDNRQVSGLRIIAHLNDSTVDRVHVAGNALMVEEIEPEIYNQLAGQEMLSYFEDNELRRMDVNGSVQGVMYPAEEDSTINKIVNVESSFLKATFKGREIERALFWPETSGTVTPIFLAKKSLMFLPRFNWQGALRPKDRDDIFPRQTPQL